MSHLKKLYEAQEQLKEVLLKTPLIYSPGFSEEYHNQVYIKPENLQKTGAFKIRGAYNKITHLTEKEKSKGLICSSAGNHAQGVAYAAKALGVKATIVMPKTTPLIKVEATKKYGATVVLHGDVYDDAYTEAKRLEKKHDYVFIHPFDDLDIIYGQGTIGLEILEELKDVDYILVPVGGGGLISGIAMAIKESNPKIKVIGIEPRGAMAMKQSLRMNERVCLNKVDTIADGVAVKEPGVLTYELIKKYVDDIIIVDDYDLMDAFLMLVEKHKLVAENAGLLALAGLKKLDVKNKNVVSLLSGGNIDVVTISSLISKGLVSRGRIYCFSVDLPDTPGQLLQISQILSDNKANVVKLDHNQFRTTDRFHHVNLQVTIETNGHDHLKIILNALDKGGFVVEEVN
ncbi:MAG: threonine ammonia-lyase [Clostridiales bacterium]|nr:threonine ammonia-lyase [Clostridiales bacterium]